MRRWLFVLVPLVAVGLLVFARIQAKAADEAKLEAEQQARRGAPASVEIAVAQSRPLLETIEAVGTVSSPFTVDLSPRIAGRITFLEVREGDEIAAGQVVARIDPREADAAVLQNQASLSEARSRLAQAQATVLSNEVQIEQSVRQAKAEVANAQAALTQVQKNLEGRLATAQAAIKTSQAAVESAQATVRSANAELTAARAVLNNARTRLNRIQSQFDKGYIAAQEVDDAKAEVASAQATVEVRQGSIESANADLARARAQLEADQTNVQTIRASGQAEVAAAQSRIEQTRASLAQAEANRAQAPAYRENVNALRAGVDAAQAQLQSAGVQRSDTEIKSSIAGTVTARNGDPGSLASPGRAVVQVQSLDWLFIDVAVPVDQSAKVRKGLPVQIRIDGLDDQLFEGQVDQVVASANPEDRQFTVKIRVENPERQLRPGMFARVSIEVNRFDARTVIPFEAVTDDNKVTVLDAEDKAVVRDVVLGRRSGPDVEVVQGLEVGDRVVVLAYNPVREGSAVQITAERLSDGTRRPVEPPETKENP